MYLVNHIRENQSEGMSVRDAVDHAVVACINSGIMADFLKKHRSEVMDVCITEYNEKVFIDGIHAEGREEERLKTIRNLMKKGCSKEFVLSLEYSEEEYKKAEQELLVHA